MKQIKVKNHSEFITALKKFEKTHRLIDNNYDWIENNISPYSLKYVNENKEIYIKFTYEKERGKAGYWYYSIKY